MSLLSVCIPVYNGEKYIHDCLEPLVKMNDVEIICVDDGSNDNSLKILNEYREKYNFITVISQSNQGQSVARNKALEKVTGRYVTFVDVDDWLETRAIDYLKQIEKEYNPDFIQFGVISEFDGWCDKKELLYNESKLLNKKESKELYAYICGYKDSRDLGHDYFGLVSCKFYKREIIKDIKFVSDIVGEDTLFACKTIKNIKSVYFLSEYLYHYTSNDGSYSHRIMPGIISKSETMLNKLKDIMNIDNNELYKKALYDRCFFMFNWCLMAMGYFKINESNYRKAIMKEIFTKPIYQEMINNIDYIYDYNGIIKLLKNSKLNMDEKI